MVADSDEKLYDRLRARMVEVQIAGRDVTDERVLEAVGRVRRHLFVPEAQRRSAYEDRPLPIGYGQTISQPYIVARITEIAGVKEGDKVLEVGAGSGYQAAVLAEMGARVFCIERIRPLCEMARANLAAAGYKDVQVKHGDGYEGWPEQAPFDAIIVSAAAPRVPQELLDQLAEGGRLVMPVGDRLSQTLTVHTKTPRGVERTAVCGCVFVPLVRGAEGGEDGGGRAAAGGAGGA